MERWRDGEMERWISLVDFAFGLRWFKPPKFLGTRGRQEKGAGEKKWRDGEMERWRDGERERAREGGREIDR